MARVIIGVDPHKLSATIEVVDGHETLLGSGRFGTDQRGYAAMRAYAKNWPERTWAVEGSNGAGRPLAQRLLEAGELVVDVPAKLAARVRLFDTGHNRKTDARDAHSIAIVALRTTTLRVLRPDGELEALRMLCDRREEFTRLRVQTVNRLQRLLSELAPALVRRTSPPRSHGDSRHRAPARRRGQDPAQDCCLGARRPCRGRGEDDEGHRRAQDPGEGPRIAVMELHGVGPVVAARSLADVGDIARFADRNRFASWTGTAPLDAPSGEHDRHRLSRAGNRRMDHMIHIAAISQIRLDTDGRVYYQRKRAEGKKPLEALRCLKRKISDAIYRQLLDDAERAATAPGGTGPGGHCRATQESSAVDLPLLIDTSDQPLPGPATTTLRRTG